jgi:WD40 repeat protein
MYLNIGARTALLLLLIGGASFLACTPGNGPAAREMENEQAKQAEPIGKPEKRAVDSFGDPLPAGALARLGTVRYRHGKGVSFIAFSADGKKLAFAGCEAMDNAIRLIETSTGKELRTFELRPGERPWNIDLSPDGNLLAVAAFSSSKLEGGFLIWDTITGKQLTQIDAGKQPSDVVVFSPDSKVLITHHNERIGNTNNFQTRMNAWDARTGKLLHEFKELDGKVSRPAFSPDRKRLALAISPHNLEPTKGFFCDTATWRALGPMAERPLLVGPNASRHYDREFLAWSPDGKLLVGGDWFNHVDFMKAETGELIDRERLQGVGASEATPVRSVSFSHDGKMLAIVSLSGVVTIREGIGKRKVLYNLDGVHSAAVFSPTEPVLVTGGGWNPGRFGWIPGRDYPGLRFWDPSTGKEILKNDSPTATVQLTHWLDGGKLLAVSPLENCYRLWDWRTSKQVAKVPLGEKFQYVAWSAVSRDGKLLAVSQYNGKGNDETIQIFDLAAGKVFHRLESSYVRFPIGFTADGKFLLAGVDDTLVAIWDIANGKLSRRLDLKKMLGKGFVRWAAVSGDGKKLALDVWQVLVEPDPNEIDPGGTLRPMGCYRCVIDLATDKQLWCTPLDDSALRGGDTARAVDAFAFSPDGKILAERTAQKINLRDSTTGDILRVLKCEKEWYEWEKQAHALAFTPDSKKLIAADLQSNIYVWDVATGKELQKFTGHRGRIFSISVGLDGRTFATASEDSTVLIWQLDGG